MPLSYLSNWAPFRIDALGLVTLIGAEEVNRSVGRLVQSRYAKYLPLLGAHLIADNQFTTMTSGFHLYNVSDAIRTPGLSAWLTRWLKSQNLKMSTTVFEWSVAPGKSQESKSGCGKAWDALLAALIGFLTIGGSLVLVVAMGDWWGLANTISMIVSVVVRCCLVQENVDALDKAVLDACYERSGIQGGSEKVKLLISLADGRMVTMYAPRGLVLEGFTKRLTILQPRLYSYTRALGWFVFGVHVLSLGQATFLNQIYAIALLVLSTWATAKGIGSNEYYITEHISAKRVENYPFCPDKRKWAYIRLGCNGVEEESLADWGLLPRKANTKWWRDFKESEEQWKFQKYRKSYDTAKV
ncbi:uncharacterized protein F4807DRAFT_466182 [Annulohypoxylon truncatum]|uniref:uncharacterized protein n=1 Tax=Annulohypoxylon truncatum TaxID=327061 RepID=UPI002007F586|nr:uncharacterized protein F4807DRAFT_466182 [Annulohypoxylon truncatum]KAI1214587.1 hypothetical protein F4807DRAFT_466182 [Annulohypoxylon truncatum]